MRSRRSRGFFAVPSFLTSLRSIRCSPERNSALIGTAAPLLGRASGQPPKPRGSRRRREGLTALARAEPRWRWAAACVTPLLTALRGVLRSIHAFCPFDPRRSLSRYAASPHQLISGGESAPTKVPLATARAQAPRRMGPIYYAAYCSPATNRSHIHLGSVCSFRRCL